MSKRYEEAPYGWTLGPEGRYVPAEKRRRTDAEKWQLLMDWVVGILGWGLILFFLIGPFL
jgi:hypothetical protein